MSTKPTDPPAHSQTPTPPGIGARLRERRKELGFSLQDLAGRTNLTASFLSLVERDRNQPSLDSLRRIADALQVPPFYFTHANGVNPVVRHNERVRLTFPNNGVTAELLVPSLRGRLEVFITRARPSAGNIALPPNHDTEECLVVMEGQLRVKLTTGEYLLEAGDSITFHGPSLQEIAASGRRETVFLSASTPPVF
ncbi:MAG: helix-turn-helix transcriptional regulator [Anaerolineales bacterium]|nr:helix-turn-helix transcriptional regulator [Anaerolineales bacterium]